MGNLEKEQQKAQSVVIGLRSAQLLLYGKKISDRDIELVARYLKRHNFSVEPLSNLNIGNNRIGSNGVKFIAESFSLSNLIYLSLYDNIIGNQGAKHLANGPLQNLKSLFLGKNRIGDTGAKHICYGNVANLELLYLGNNEIRDAGAESITNGNWVILKTLDLSQNRINDGGVDHLINCRVKNLNSVFITSSKIFRQKKQRIRQFHLQNQKGLKLQIFL